MNARKNRCQTVVRIESLETRETPSGMGITGSLVRAHLAPISHPMSHHPASTHQPIHHAPLLQHRPPTVTAPHSGTHLPVSVPKPIHKVNVPGVPQHTGPARTVAVLKEKLAGTRAVEQRLTSELRRAEAVLKAQTGHPGSGANHIKLHPHAPVKLHPHAPVKLHPHAPVKLHPHAPVKLKPIVPVKPQPHAPVKLKPIAPVKPQPIAPVKPQPIAPVKLNLDRPIRR
jgi:hypothetical protein